MNNHSYLVIKGDSLLKILTQQGTKAKTAIWAMRPYCV